MEIIKAIIFGIVEGITEWLPISSTGHMILLNEFIRLDVSDAFYELFEVVIQLGAILAVIFLYWNKVCPWGKGKSKESTYASYRLWLKMFIACIPAGILGILFDDFLNEKLHTPVIVAIALIVYGIIFIAIEQKDLTNRRTRSLDTITYRQAFYVGIFQVLSLIPGTSRSGSTILGGLICGMERKTIADFTFILAIPVMLGASLIKLVKYIAKTGLAFQAGEIGILIVGSITAFIISVMVIRFLLNYIRKHDFKVFGYYRIILGIIVLLYFLVIR